MRFKKKLLTLIILILSVFTFTGCANVEFVRKFYSSNEIFDRIVIELKKDELEKFGYSINDAMTIINEDLNDVRDYVENWKKSFFDIEGIENIAKKVSVGINVKVDRPSNISNRIYLTVIFSDITMFGLFYGYTSIPNYEYDKAMNDVGPFIDKIISDDYSTEDYGLFLYKTAIIKNGGILDSLKDFEINGVNYHNKYRKEFGYNYNSDDINFYEMFTYPDDRLYSNADDSEVTGGIAIHRWYLTDKDENFEMILYKLSPKTSTWYLLALIISLTFVVVISVVLIILKYKKNKIKMEKVNE
jgi:hypothetical protein